MSVQIAALGPGVLLTENSSGDLIPLVGREVYIYLRGTTTPGLVFQDSGLTVAQTQPISSLSNGSIPGYVAATVALDVYDTVSGTRIALEPLADEGSAPIASPTFTGTPTAPTAAPGTNSTQLATTAFVAAAIAAALSGAPVIVDPPVVS